MPAPKKRMNLRQQEAHATNLVAQWNQKYPHGALVSYEDIKGRGESVRCNTRGQAYVMCCEPVVHLEQWSGSVSLEHCTAIEALKPPVQRITLEDHGQDFTDWYVRDGIVIDCQPHQGAIWVGIKVLNQKSLKPGVQIEIKSRATGQPTPLSYPVQAVETLSLEEAAKVEGFGREWAKIQGVYVDSLGLEPVAEEAQA